MFKIILMLVVMIVPVAGSCDDLSLEVAWFTSDRRKIPFLYRPTSQEVKHLLRTGKLVQNHRIWRLIGYDWKSLKRILSKGAFTTNIVSDQRFFHEPFRVNLDEKMIFLDLIFVSKVLTINKVLQTGEVVTLNKMSRVIMGTRLTEEELSIPIIEVIGRQLPAFNLMHQHRRDRVYFAESTLDWLMRLRLFVKPEFSSALNEEIAEAEYEEEDEENCGD